MLWILRFVLYLAFFALNGCIEVRNSDVNNVKSLNKIEMLVVSGPVFFHEGRFLDEESFLAIRYEDRQPDKLLLDRFEIVVETLKFGPEGVLYTLGNDLTMNVQQLVSYSGRIQTFPENFKAQNGNNGESGGRLNISVDRAEGHLQIAMRGQDGGDGPSGEPPNESLRGKNGLVERDVRVVAGIGGVQYMPILVSRSGGKGLSGFPGQNGGRGGDSGTLKFELSEDNGFSVNVLKFPGQGGQGGVGGSGGPGGLPGILETSVHKNMKLLFVKSGKNGPQGDSGPAGKNGERGMKELSCLKIESKEKCEV